MKKNINQYLSELHSKYGIEERNGKIRKEDFAKLKENITPKELYTITLCSLETKNKDRDYEAIAEYLLDNGLLVKLKGMD